MFRTVLPKRTPASSVSNTRTPSALMWPMPGSRVGRSKEVAAAGWVIRDGSVCVLGRAGPGRVADDVGREELVCVVDRGDREGLVCVVGWGGRGGPGSVVGWVG